MVGIIGFPYVFLTNMELATFIDHSLPKKDRYGTLATALSGLLDGEDDFLANQANAVALIFHSFDFHWVGFYWVKADELILGAFQGPVACTRIPKGKGVCGTAWASESVQLVPNVHEFPGHIACSALTNSELVLPLLVNGQVVGVLDIDSVFLNDFDQDDIEGMQQLMDLLLTKWRK